MPLRLIERIDPFGRTLAVPPPFKETVLPGGVRLPTLPRVAAAAVCGAAVLGRPVAVLGRAPVFVRPVVAARPEGVVARPVVAGRLIVGPVRPVDPGVDVRPVGPVRPVVVREGVELRDGAELWDGAELRDGAELCDGADVCGALAWEGALGLLGSFLCWPSTNVGIAINNRRIPDFRNVFSNFEMRFITASWPLNFLLLSCKTLPIHNPRHPRGTCHSLQN
jgi:hypothetical protein